MVLNKTILILEDDLRTLSKLLEKLSKLEDDQPYSFSLIILTDYIMVEEFINKDPMPKIDLILLDRDCKLGGSFHVLDIEKIGAKKIIAISSVPEYNQEAKKRGIKKIVQKDYAMLEKFSDDVIQEIENFLRPSWLNLRWLDKTRKRDNITL